MCCIRTTPALLLLMLCPSLAEAADPVPKSDSKSLSGLVVWDTVEPFEPALVFKTPGILVTKWKVVPPEITVESFKGDAVLSNGGLTAVLRKKAAALEVRSP